MLRFWDRTQPLKSISIIILGVAMLFELFLLFSGRWILIGSERGSDSNAFLGGASGIHMFPATSTWDTMECRYWTGRSVQVVSDTNRFGPLPAECPFMSRPMT